MSRVTGTRALVSQLHRTDTLLNQSNGAIAYRIFAIMLKHCLKLKKVFKDTSFQILHKFLFFFPILGD